MSTNLQLPPTRGEASLVKRLKGPFTKNSRIAFILQLQARYALAGWTVPNTGEVQEGASWLFDNVERVTTMYVTAYSPH